MEIVEVKLPVEKNFKEIVDFLILGILDKVLRGASLDEYMAELPKLMAAADGYKEAFDAMSSQQRNECIAYALYQIGEVAAPDVPPAPEVAVEEPAAPPAE